VETAVLVDHHHGPRFDLARVTNVELFGAVCILERCPVGTVERIVALPSVLLSPALRLALLSFSSAAGSPSSRLSFTEPELALTFVSISASTGNGIFCLDCPFG
jgi:hypothetical protein